MSTETPFKVAARDLPAKRRIEITPAFVAAAVEGMQMREALENDPATARDGGVADLELNEDGTSVFVQGSVTGQVIVACSRCLGPVAVPIDERIRVTYIPADELPAGGDEAEGEEGVELGEQELDVYAYDGEVVDLEPLVREQFVLAVPYAPLCREDCAGLCPQCGIDRNVATCDCEKPIDPRFGPLTGLKLPT